ncbi:hypothetical protein B0H11DRAFT_2184309 [Mycena galericulata]|nr:hypothetical protein B0H11DRAFT_2184309 [Mycena galericulata]
MLVNAAIQAFDMAALIPRKPTVSYSEVIRHILELIRFCFQVDAVSRCQDFLLELLEPPAGFTIYQHVDKVLVPLISVLKTFLATVQLDYQSDPFRTLRKYHRGLKLHQLAAASELEGVVCNSCSECAALRAFFHGRCPNERFPRVEAKHSHPEHQLSATSAWGVTWDTHKLGSPHTLRITKPASMTTANPVHSNQRGMAPLAELGDSAKQRVILGPDHDWILAKDGGPEKEYHAVDQPETAQHATRERRAGSKESSEGSRRPNGSIGPELNAKSAMHREEKAPRGGRERVIAEETIWMEFAEVVDMRQSSIVDKDASPVSLGQGPNRVRSPSQLGEVVIEFRYTVQRTDKTRKGYK